LSPQHRSDLLDPSAERARLHGNMEKHEKKQLIELLNKCWMTHDGMWFYHCVQQIGVQKANQLNKAAIRALAPVEIGRIKDYLGMDAERIDTFNAFQRLFTGASELFIPDFMNVTMSFPQKNILHWRFKPNGCFAYKGIKRIGVIEDYECGVIYRIECWIESLGIGYEVTPRIKKCVMRSHSACSGNFCLAFEH
jgi:hypothetical protein